MPITNRQKALLHVAKSKLGMSDTEYRDMLARFGVASSTQLTGEAFDLVMQHLAKIGFVSPRKAARKGRPASSKELLAGKIKAMAHAMKLPRAYLDAIARNMFHVDSWMWLDATQMGKLVAALQYHQARRDKREGR